MTGPRENPQPEPDLRLGERLSLRGAHRQRAAAALAAALAPLAVHGDSQLAALLAGILADSRLEDADETCDGEDGGSGQLLQQPWRPEQQQQQQQSRLTDAEATAGAVAALPPCTPPPASRPAYPQPAPCAFLRPGQAFEGRQRVAQSGGNPKQEHWEVHASIQRYDPTTGYVCGTMEAANVPESLDPVTTFFEGEVVDNVNHTFYTADWNACADTDFRHWSRFDSFRELCGEVARNAGRCPSLAAHPFVYMRWKEQFFLRGSECRLTIAGFYYLSLDRRSGKVAGCYFDPASTPDQRLELGAVPAGAAGFAFPHFELA